MAAAVDGDMTAGAYRLRPDVELLAAGGAGLGGAPALLVHDPVAETFDRVEWPESDLLRILREGARDGVTAEELRERFMRGCTLRPAAEDVAAYLKQLAGKGWLRPPPALSGMPPGMLWPKSFSPRPKPGLSAALSSLLFLQIPLVRPAGFLRATAGAAGMFLNRYFAAFVVFAGLCGLYLALPRWEEFWATVAGSATLAGAPGFLAALIGLKVVHEFAHACTATLAGARVKRMGIALFFLLPLPFTDVTDAWRLGWPARLRLAAAGLCAETAAGALSLLLWALAPPGEAAATLARLATVSVLSTLMTNINPGLRFDGYFILVCLTKTENLRARGTDALRTLLRRAVFGIMGGIADEEPGGGAAAGRTGQTHAPGLYVYAVYALVYRVLIGAGLIALAYGFLPKALGLPVAALEVYAFFLAPAARECAGLWRRRGAMRFTVWSGIFLALALASGVWFFGSWPRRLAFPAVTRAEAEEAVRALRPGTVTKILAARGDAVAEGQILAELESPAEAFDLDRARWAVREAEISAAQAWAGALARRESIPRAAELRRREDELTALLGRESLLAVRAPVSGTLAAWDESLVPGVAVGTGGVLGNVVRGGAGRLSCYPDVEAAGRFDEGAEAWFLPDSGGGRLRGTVTEIGQSAIAARGVEDAELAPAFAAVPNAMPRVRVIVMLDEPVDRTGQTGTVIVRSRPESPASRAAAWLRNLAVRESAF